MYVATIPPTVHLTSSSGSIGSPPAVFPGLPRPGPPRALKHLADRMRDGQPWTVYRLAARLDDQTDGCQQLAEVHARFDAAYHALSGPVRRIYRLLALTP
jgi:hypothetical protein